MEQILSPGRSSAPLELDIHLQNNTAVEGSYLDGTIILKVTKLRKKDPSIRIGSSKIRLVGFEATNADRHTFYQHTVPLQQAAPSFRTLFRPSSDLDDFRAAQAGTYFAPFSLILPRSSGAKGSVVGRTSVSIGYIILV